MGPLVKPMLELPAGLEFDPERDPARGRHLVLGAPWGARVHPLHESGADRIEPHDFVVDRALVESGLAVNVNHDPRRKVGRIVDATTDDRGLWIVVELNEEGEEILQSDGRVSIEVIMPRFRWILSGLALLTPDAEAGIEGAQVVFSSAGERVFWVEAVSQPEPGLSDIAQVARRADREGGVVVIDPFGANRAAREAAWLERHRPIRPAVDIGAAKEFLHQMSMASVHEEVDRARRLFEQSRAVYRDDDDIVRWHEWARRSLETTRRQRAERRAREEAARRAPVVEQAWLRGRWAAEDAAGNDAATDTRGKGWEWLRRILRAR